MTPAAVSALRLTLPGLDPPVDPGGEKARQLLGRELAKPEYYDANIVERIYDWLERVFDDSVGIAEDTPPLGTFAAILVGLLLVAAITLLVSRARRTARSAAEKSPALTDEAITAAELRERAEAALRDGRHGDALVDAFRALALRQVERGRIDDVPQATAHELARVLGAEFPQHRGRVDHAADLFDAVLYGDHPADRDQASELLALDDALAGRAARR